MNRVISIFALLLLGATGGCGVTFQNIPNLDQPLNGDMLGRRVIDDSALMQRHLDQVAGLMIYEKAGGVFEIHAPLPLAKTPDLKAISGDTATFYHSLVDAKAGAQGSYLAFAASLDVHTKCEVTVLETAECFIDNADLPKDAIRAIANSAKPTGILHRWFVQGALLTVITKDYYGEISANGGVADGGKAVGIGGKVYASATNSQTSHEARIGAHLIDVDTYFQESANHVQPRLQISSPIHLE